MKFVNACSNEYIQYLKMFGVHSLKVCLITFNYVYHYTALSLKKNQWGQGSILFEAVMQITKITKN
jgi:hypothetical protein